MKKCEKQIVLVYPKMTRLEITNIMAPYSVLFPGSHLANNGFKVKIFDMRIDSENELFTFLDENRVLFLGISFMTGPQINYSIKLITAIRERYREPIIVAGGVHPTLFPEDTLKSGLFDIVVRNEGEETVLELSRALCEGRSLSEIKGVSYLEGKTIVGNPEREFIRNLDIVSLDWELLDINRYVFTDENGKRGIIFFTSRGCPFNCSFCYNLVYNKRRWRGWSLEKSFFELDKILRLARVEKVVFHDDNFSVDKKRILGFCEYLKRNSLEWYCDLRVDSVDKSILKEMSDSGCRKVFIGGESGSNNILDMIHKGYTVEKLKQCLNLFINSKINVDASWIIGFPDEAKDDMWKTIKLVKEIRRLLPESIHFIKAYTPNPGSRLYARAIELGFKPPGRLQDWGNFTRENYNLDCLGNKWFINSVVYASYFTLGVKDYEKPKGIMKIPFKCIQLISKLRWKLNFFYFPLEYYLISKIMRRFYYS